MLTTVSIPRDMLDGAEDETQQAELGTGAAVERDTRQLEGSLHFCEGPLLRKRHRAQAKKKKWKQKWFRVEPGEFVLFVECKLLLEAS